MAPRLKVFTWSDGFHPFTVATTSRAKALDAWGSRQDLFATGLASELSGGPDHDAAQASPRVVVERGLAVDIGKLAGFCVMDRDLRDVGSLSTERTRHGGRQAKRRDRRVRANGQGNDLF